MTIKDTIRQWVKKQDKGTRFMAKTLWWDLFHYQIARGSVTNALSGLRDEGLIRRSEYMIGRNSSWIIS